MGIFIIAEKGYDASWGWGGWGWGRREIIIVEDCGRQVLSNQNKNFKIGIILWNSSIVSFGHLSDGAKDFFLFHFYWNKIIFKMFAMLSAVPNFETQNVDSTQLRGRLRMRTRWSIEDEMMNPKPMQFPLHSATSVQPKK